MRSNVRFLVKWPLVTPWLMVKWPLVTPWPLFTPWLMVKWPLVTPWPPVTPWPMVKCKVVNLFTFILQCTRCLCQSVKCVFIYYYYVVCQYDSVYTCICVVNCHRFLILIYIFQGRYGQSDWPRSQPPDWSRWPSLPISWLIFRSLAVIISSWYHHASTSATYIHRTVPTQISIFINTCIAYIFLTITLEHEYLVFRLIWPTVFGVPSHKDS